MRQLIARNTCEKAVTAILYRLISKKLKGTLKTGGIPFMSIHTCTTAGELRLDVIRAKKNRVD